MNPYQPPLTTPLEEEHSVHWPYVTAGASFIAGAVSYYVFHYLSGVLGSMPLPASMKSVARLFKPITMPLVDLLLLGTPLVIAYALVSYVWFKAIGSTAKTSLVSFCFGWLVPALVVVGYGESRSPGTFLELWAQWPHVGLLHFSPLLGIWFGFWLSSMHSSRAAHAA